MATGTRAVVIVTGASRGLGKAVVEELLAMDVNVIANGTTRLQDAPLFELMSSPRVKDMSERLVYIQGDVTDRKVQMSLVNRAKDLWGRLDALVNNAGVIQVNKIRDVDMEAFSRVLDVNLTCVVSLTQLAIPLLCVAPNGGRIINVSSGAADKAYEGWGSYCISKAGECSSCEGMFLGVVLILSRHEHALFRARPRTTVNHNRLSPTGRRGHAHARRHPRDWPPRHEQ